MTMLDALIGPVLGLALACLFALAVACVLLRERDPAARVTTLAASRPWLAGGILLCGFVVAVLLVLRFGVMS